MPSDTQVLPERPGSFAELRKWVENGTILDRTSADTIQRALGQEGVKLKIAGVLVARSHLARIDRLRQLLEGVDGIPGVEGILLDPNRVKRMKNTELIELYRTLARLKYDTEKAFVNAVLNPDTKLTPDPEDLRDALSNGEVVTTTKEQRDEILMKVGLVIGRPTRLIEATVSRVVSDPPVVT